MRPIDADELKKAIMLKEDVAYETWNELYDSVLEEIDNAPTVDLWEMRQEATENALKKAEVLYKRPQGKWIKIFSNPFTDGYICSVCGHKIQVTEQFLPQITQCEVCGSEMRGNNNETN